MASMRRLIAIAAFALFLTVPVWAQHGGGGHGGGGGGHAGGFGGGHSGGFAGHSGFSGGHSISSGGPAVHSFSGIRSQARGPAVSRPFSAPSSRIPSSRFSSSRALSARAGFSRGPFLHDGFRNRNFGFRNFGFRNNCFGFPCRGGYGWPWGYAGFYDPWWWWNSDSNYDQDYNDNLALAQQMNEQSLEEQQMLRQEGADGDQDAYARSAPPRPVREEEKQGTAIIPATALVFRDQHRQEVDNYAIVGQTLWVFAPKQAQKIALPDLDVPATVKANEDRGVTFRIPVPNEAQ
jgi:hypothetical protein